MQRLYREKPRGKMAVQPPRNQKKLARKRPTSSRPTTSLLGHFYLALLYLLLSTTLLVWRDLRGDAPLILGVRAVPCVAQTAFYGPNDTNDYVEIIEQADDTVRLINMYYCYQEGYGVANQHFRGFRATFSSVTGGNVEQVFGTLQPGGNPLTQCFDVPITEEIMYVTIYSDFNDVEGIVMEGHNGTEYVMRANGNNVSPKFQMAGRPIGFGVYMGSGGTDNQPIQLSVMYNECNCPASTFMENAPPADLTIEAVVGVSQSVTLPYQANYMEYSYVQDCGAYSTSVSPTKSYMTLSDSGATSGPFNHQYTDVLDLVAPPLSEIGQHTITLNVFQTSSQGYTLPASGQMPAISYDFTLTVNPCVSSISTTTLIADSTYQISEAEVTEAYQFDFGVACGYTATYTVSSSPTPATIFWTNTPNQSLKWYTLDKSLAGTAYTITVEASYSEFDDHTKTSSTTKSASFSFVLTVEDPCASVPTQLILPWVVNDMTFDLKDYPVATEQQLVDPKDTVSDTMYNMDGYSLCGPLDVSLIAANPGTPHFSGFLSYDQTSKKLSLVTNDVTHVGQYYVTIEAYLTGYQTVRNSPTFVVDVTNLCAGTTINSFAANDMTFTIGDAAETQNVVPPTDSVSLVRGDLSGLTYCGLRTISITSATPASPTLSNYLTLDTANNNLLSVSTGLKGDSGVYDVTIQATLASFPSAAAITATFKVTILDGCLLSVLSNPTASNMVYAVGNSTPATQTIAKPTDTQSLAVGDQTGLTFCGNRNFRIASVSPTSPPYSNYLTLDTNTGQIDISSGTLSDQGLYTVTLEAFLVDLTTSVNSVSSTTFTVEIQDPCLGSTLDTLSLSDMTTYVSDATAETQTVTIPTDSVSLANGDLTGLTFCGTKTLSLVSVTPNSPNYTNFLSFDATQSPQLSSQTSLTSDKGVYTVLLQVQLDNYTSITKTGSFTLTVIDRCESTNLNPLVLADMTTYVNDVSSADQTPLQPTDSISMAHGDQTGLTFCGPRTLSLVSVSPNTPAYSNFLTFDPTGTPILSAQTNLVSDHGAYTVTLQTTLDNYPIKTVQSTFTLNVIDRCLTTSLNPLVVNDMTVYVNEPTSEDQIVADVKDSVSLAHGDQTGLTFCGPRTLNLASVTPSTPYYTNFLTFAATTSPQLKGQTTLTSDKGVYTIQMSVLLDNYQSITNIATFTLTVIDRCEITTLNPLILQDMTVFIKEPTPLNQIVANVFDSVSLANGDQSGLSFCGSRTLTLNSVTPNSPNYTNFLTFDGTQSPQLIGQTSLTSDAGIYTVQLQLTLDDYSSIYKTAQFTLTVIDRCDTTNKNPLILSDMTTYVHDGTPVVQTPLQATDSISLAHGDQTGLTFCGPRTISLVSVMPSSPPYANFLTFNPTGSPILIAQSFLASDHGTYTVTLQTTLDEYSTKSEQSSFTLIVIDRCLTSSLDPLVVNDMTVYVNEPSSEDQVVANVKDSVSITHGDQSGLTFCGPRTLSLVSVTPNSPNYTNFLTFDATQSPQLSSQTSLTSDKGVYTVLLQVQLDNYTSITKTGSFTLTVIDRCESTNLNPLVLADMTTYANDVSSADQTPLLPTDSISMAHGDQTGLTFCGPRTLILVSVSPNTPAYSNFLTFDPTGTPILSAQTNLVSDHGTYTVTLQTTLDNYPTKTVQSTFTLNVIDRCLTTTLDPLVVNPMTVYVNEPTSEDQIVADVKDSVSLAQGDQSGLTFCGPRTLNLVSVTPSIPYYTNFLTFDATTSPQLKGQTTLTSDKGVYTVQMSILLDNYLSITKTTSFTLTVIDRCENTVVESLSVRNMYTFITGSADTQNIQLPNDSISLAHGDLSGQTFCGPRTLYLSSVVPSTPPNGNFMTFNANPASITAQSNSDVDQGIYQISLLFSLDNYPQFQQTSIVTLEIDWCQVSTLTMTPIVDQSYNIYQIPTTFSFTDFVQSPDCQYTLNYAIELITLGSSGNVQNIPTALVQYDQSSKTFSVQSNDATQDVGLYQIKITGSVPLAKMNPIKQNELFVNLSVSDGCASDTILNTAILPVTILHIIDSPQLDLNPSWTQLDTQCPSTRQLLRKVNSVPQPLTSYEFEALVFNSATGQLTVDTSDYKFDGEVWDLELFMDSTFSTNANKRGSYSFSVEFRDRCWDSVLSPATIPSAPYTFELWAPEVMFFNSMTSIPDGISGCGGFTYDLEYLSGPLLAANIDHSTIYSLPVGLDKIQGTPSSRDWFGIHSYRLKCTNGRSLTSRGTNGLFNSIYSQSFTVTINDPCITTVVNSPQLFSITNLVANIDKQLKISGPLTGPNDSVSHFANSHKLCGNFNYELLAQNGQDKPFFLNDPWITMSVLRANSGPDTIDFSVQSYPYGKEISKSLVLDVSLQDYSSSTKAQISFDVTYRICDVALFRGTPISDQIYEIGSNELTIPLNFDQYPCAYNQNYTVFLVQKQSLFETELPQFASQDLLSPSFSVYTTDPQFIGTYTFAVYSQLKSEIRIEARLEFKLEIRNPQGQIITVSPNDVDYYIEPPPLIDIPDMHLDWESGKTISIGDDFKGEFGDKLSVDVKLGEADSFVEWDVEKNEFVIKEGAVTPDLNGTYPIEIEFSYQNSTYKETYTKTFEVQIDPPLDQIPPTFAGIQFRNEYETIEETIVETRFTQEPEPYSPEQPVPYIEELTETGLLTIGWDRFMEKPEDPSEIRPSKVGITETDLPPDYSKLPQRKLQERVHNWYTDKKAYLEWLMIVDALEIKVEPGEYSNPALLQLKDWKVVNFSATQIWIQIYFEYPDNISEKVVGDDLTVTFWGTEFFKAKNGKKVRYGTKIQQKILRVVDPEIAVSLGVTGLTMNSITSLVLIFAFILALICTGRLITIFMFMNTMQLILHLPLFEVHFPAKASFFFKQMLDLFRFELLNINQRLCQLFDFKPQSKAFSTYFEVMGYKYTEIFINMGLILTLFAIASLSFIFLKIKECIVSRCSNKISVKDRVLRENQSDQASNFLVRLFYQTHFEIAICSMIYLDQILRKGEDQPVAPIIICICMLLGVIIFPIWAHFAYKTPQKLVQQNLVRKIFANIGSQKDSKIAKISQKEVGNNYDSPMRFNRQILPFGRSNTYNYEEKQSADQQKMANSFVEQGLKSALNFKNLLKSDIISSESSSNSVQISRDKIQEEDLPSNQNEKYSKAFSGSFIGFRKSNEQSPDMNSGMYEGGEELNITDQNLVYNTFESPFTPVNKNEKIKEQDDLNLELQKEEIQMQLDVEDQLRQFYPKSYKTLFNGHLPSITSQNRTHVQLFFWRRIILATSLIYLPQSCIIFGLLAFQFTCVGELAIVLQGKLWEDKWVARQHLLNEIATYFITMEMIYFTTEPADGVTMAYHGTALITIITSLIVFNIVIIVVDQMKNFVKICNRAKNIHRYRALKSYKEISALSQQIDAEKLGESNAIRQQQNLKLIELKRKDQDLLVKQLLKAKIAETDLNLTEQKLITDTSNAEALGPIRDINKNNFATDLDIIVQDIDKKKALNSTIELDLNTRGGSGSKLPTNQADFIQITPKNESEKKKQLSRISDIENQGFYQDYQDSIYERSLINSNISAKEKINKSKERTGNSGDIKVPDFSKSKLNKKAKVSFCDIYNDSKISSPRYEKNKDKKSSFEAKKILANEHENLSQFQPFTEHQLDPSQRESQKSDLYNQNQLVNHNDENLLEASNHLKSKSVIIESDKIIQESNSEVKKSSVQIQKAESKFLKIENLLKEAEISLQDRRDPNQGLNLDSNVNFQAVSYLQQVQDNDLTNSRKTLSKKEEHIEAKSLQRSKQSEQKSQHAEKLKKGEKSSDLSQKLSQQLSGVSSSSNSAQTETNKERSFETSSMSIGDCSSERSSSSDNESLSNIENLQSQKNPKDQNTNYSGHKSKQETFSTHIKEQLHSRKHGQLGKLSNEIAQKDSEMTSHSEITQPTKGIFGNFKKSLMKVLGQNDESKSQQNEGNSKIIPIKESILNKISQNEFKMSSQSRKSVKFEIDAESLKRSVAAANNCLNNKSTISDMQKQTKNDNNIRIPIIPQQIDKKQVSFKRKSGDFHIESQLKLFEGPEALVSKQNSQLRRKSVSPDTTPCFQEEMLLAMELQQNNNNVGQRSKKRKLSFAQLDKFQLKALANQSKNISSSEITSNLSYPSQPIQKIAGQLEKSTFANQKQTPQPYEEVKLDKNRFIANGKPHSGQSLIKDQIFRAPQFGNDSQIVSAQGQQRQVVDKKLDVDELKSFGDTFSSKAYKHQNLPLLNPNLTSMTQNNQNMDQLVAPQRSSRLENHSENNVDSSQNLGNYKPKIINLTTLQKQGDNLQSLAPNRQLSLVSAPNFDNNFIMSSSMVENRSANDLITAQRNQMNEKPSKSSLLETLEQISKRDSKTGYDQTKSIRFNNDVQNLQQLQKIPDQTRNLLAQRQDRSQNTAGKMQNSYLQNQLSYHREEIPKDLPKTGTKREKLQRHISPLKGSHIRDLISVSSRNLTNLSQTSQKKKGRSPSRNLKNSKQLLQTHPDVISPTNILDPNFDSRSINARNADMRPLGGSQQVNLQRQRTITERSSAAKQCAQTLLETSIGQTYTARQRTGNTDQQVQSADRLIHLNQRTFEGNQLADRRPEELVLKNQLMIEDQTVRVEEDPTRSNRFKMGLNGGQQKSQQQKQSLSQPRKHHENMIIQTLTSVSSEDQIGGGGGTGGNHLSRGLSQEHRNNYDFDLAIKHMAERREMGVTEQISESSNHNDNKNPKEFEHFTMMHLNGKRNQKRKTHASQSMAPHSFQNDHHANKNYHNSHQKPSLSQLPVIMPHQSTSGQNQQMMYQSESISPQRTRNVYLVKNVGFKHLIESPSEQQHSKVMHTQKKAKAVKAAKRKTKIINSYL